MSAVGALVITRNEERNIEACLDSLAFCSERVVVDSFSEDATVERALPRADRIYRRTFVRWGEQKNWGLAQLSTPWALIVDADERVPSALAEEILAAVARDEMDAFWIRRRNRFFGRPIRGAGWGRDRVLRLVRRGRGAYDARAVHEEIRMDPGSRVGILRGRLEHDSYQDWPSTFERLLVYSGRGAADAAARGKGASTLRLALAPSARFWKQYLLQGGFRDGVHGMILCGLGATGVFLRLAKLRLGELPPVPEAEAVRVETVRGPAPTAPAGEEEA